MRWTLILMLATGFALSTSRAHPDDGLKSWKKNEKAVIAKVEAAIKPLVAKYFPEAKIERPSSGSLHFQFGLQKKKKYTVSHHDLDHLFGRWTEKEYNQIQNKIDSERKIDKELWE